MLMTMLTQLSSRRTTANTSRSTCSTLFQLLLLGATLCLTSVAGAGIVHKEHSLYQNIVVKDTEGNRCLQFRRKRANHNQSCRDLKRPEQLVFPYTRMMFAALLLNRTPDRILIVGLGGGSMPDALATMLPNAHIDVVEIDPAVVRIAGEYFGFTQGKSMQVFAQDARVFIKRALRNKADAGGYDIIMLDAFTGDYIPEHLMTAEFLREAQALLTPDGVLAANTFLTSKLYDHESVTYASVFGEFFSLTHPSSLNRIILATAQELPTRATLEERARALASVMSKHRIEIRDFPKKMVTSVDWDTSARPLTDQYSPANLLRSQKRK